MNLEDICLEEAKNHNGELKNSAHVYDSAKVVEVAIRPSSNQNQRIGYVFNSIDDALNYLLAVKRTNEKQAKAASLLVSIGQDKINMEWPDNKYFPQPLSAAVGQALTYLNLCRIRAMHNLEDFPDFAKFLEQIKKKELDVNEGLPIIGCDTEGNHYYINNDGERRLLSYAIEFKKYDVMKELLDLGGDPTLQDGLILHQRDNENLFFESLKPTSNNIDRSNGAIDGRSPIVKLIDADDIKGLSLILLHTKGEDLRRACFSELLRKLEPQTRYDLIVRGRYNDEPISMTNQLGELIPMTNQLKRELFSSLSESQLREFLIKVNEKHTAQELIEMVSLVMKKEFTSQWGNVQSELTNIQRDNSGTEALSKKLNLCVLQLQGPFVKLDRGKVMDVRHGDLFSRGMQLAIARNLNPSSPEFKQAFKEQIIDDRFGENTKKLSEESKTFSMIINNENERFYICGGSKGNCLVIDSLEPTPEVFMLEIDKTVRETVNQYNQAKNDSSESSPVLGVGMFHKNEGERRASPNDSLGDPKEKNIAHAKRKVMIDFSNIAAHPYIRGGLCVARGHECSSFRDEATRTEAAAMITEVLAQANLSDVKIKTEVMMGDSGSYVIDGIKSLEDAEKLYDTFVFNGYAVDSTDVKESFLRKVESELSLGSGPTLAS